MSWKTEKALLKAKKMVEAIIRELDVEPHENMVETARGGYAWQLVRGSADILVSLIPGVADRYGRLRIVSPIVKMEQGIGETLALRLLALNGTDMPGVFFGSVSGNVVAIVSERSVCGLDKQEARELLEHVGFLGDKYDDVLVNEFGGTRVCDLR